MVESAGRTCSWGLEKSSSSVPGAQDAGLTGQASQPASRSIGGGPWLSDVPPLVFCLPSAPLQALREAGCARSAALDITPQPPPQLQPWYGSLCPVRVSARGHTHTLTHAHSLDQGTCVDTNRNGVLVGASAQWHAMQAAMSLIAAFYYPRAEHRT